MKSGKRIDLSDSVSLWLCMTELMIGNDDLSSETNILLNGLGWPPYPICHLRLISF